MHDFGQTEKNPSFFYDKGDFPFLKPIEENFPAILTELVMLHMKDEADWLTSFPNYVKGEREKAWQVFNFSLFCMKFPANAKLCPITAKLLYSIPEIISANYSWMKAQTHIQPHKGYSRMQLRCHLPLVIPDESLCGIRVGNETQHWKPGELMIFDDSFEHEAWNKTDSLRVVLMFDIPNPHWGYSAYEISKYKIDRLDDPFLLGLAPKEKWIEGLERGVAPIDAGWTM